jgi:hypothetical protein
MNVLCDSGGDEHHREEVCRIGGDAAGGDNFFVCVADSHTELNRDFRRSIPPGGRDTSFSAGALVFAVAQAQ